MTDSESNREIKKPRLAQLDQLRISAVTAVLASMLNIFFVANTHMPTGPMITTIMSGNHVINSRLSYRFKDPVRGGTIIFHAPDEPETLYVKRTTDLLGDKVTIRDGHVYLNNSETPLEESYTKELMEPAVLQGFQVPEGVYFYMGDNQNGSVDAYYWKNYYVYRDKIIARVLFHYWPGIKTLK